MANKNDFQKFSMFVFKCFWAHKLDLTKHPQLFLTTRQWSCGKVMFLAVCVCSWEGVPKWPLPMMHLTSLYRPPATLLLTWDLTGKGFHFEGTPLLVTSGGRHWRHVQTCSLQDIWWLLKHIWSVQAGGMHPTRILSCLPCAVKIPKMLIKSDLKPIRQFYEPPKIQLFGTDMLAIVDLMTRPYSEQKRTSCQFSVL